MKQMAMPRWALCRRGDRVALPDRDVVMLAALVESQEHRTIALPSGPLIVSTGMLRLLEDEAELAFVLGHEIAHAASGEAAVRLVRLGFRATTREREASDGLCWSDAAVDLALARSRGDGKQRVQV